MSNSAPRLYDTWLPAAGRRILGLNTVGAISAFVAVIIVMIGLSMSAFLFCLSVIITELIFLAFVSSPLGSLLMRHIKFFIASRKGQTLFLSGVFGQKVHRARRRPGWLAKTNLVQYDAFGTTVGAVEVGEQITVTLECRPEGVAMREMNTINNWVSSWGALYSYLGADRALLGFKAIVCATPSDPNRFIDEAKRNRADDAPSLASRVVDLVARELPRGAAQNTVFLEVTYRTSELGRKDEERTEALISRVNEISRRAIESGAGSVRPLSTNEIAQLVRNAYDPLMPVSFPTDGSVTLETLWDEAGPVRAKEYWRSYEHDGVASVSWEMSAAPRQAIMFNSFYPLLSASQRMQWKRVAFLYLPQTQDESIAKAEVQTSSKIFSNDQSKRSRVSSYKRHEVDRARATGDEITRGASLVQVGIVITATVTDPKEISAAMNMIKSDAGSVPLHLRLSSGSQAAAFLTTLPVGLLPWRSGLIPFELRQTLAG